MEVQTGNVLSIDQALALALEQTAKIRRCIEWTIRKLAMPTSKGSGACACENAPAGARSPAAEEVRRCLARDEDLRGDVELEVFASFKKRIEKRPICDEEVAPYLYRTAQRVTRRRARAEAHRRLAELHMAPEGGDLGDVMAAVEPLPDAVLESRRLRGRLGALLLQCSEEDLQLLEASVEGRYEAVASSLGIAVQTARNKACLLRRRLRAELLD